VEKRAYSKNGMGYPLKEEAPELRNHRGINLKKALEGAENNLE